MKTEIMFILKIIDYNFFFISSCMRLIFPSLSLLFLFFVFEIFKKYDYTVVTLILNVKTFKTTKKINKHKNYAF